MSEPSGASSKERAISSDTGLEKLIHDQAPETLIAVASDSRLNEDLALALLNRRDLPRQALEELNKNGAVVRHRRVRLAIVMHPRAPRHVSIPTIRHLYPFELMQVAMFPAVAADVKRAAEESLIGKLGTVSPGERLTLAKQGSGRVAAMLLLDKEQRIMQAALTNPRMTEPLLVRALKADAGTELLAPAVCNHARWASRIEIKAALLCNAHTPFARVLQYASELPLRTLKDLLVNARLRGNARSSINAALAQRTKL
ncbi:MAG TPA: hypothetical protein VKZ53_07465 [Candidatus Angelobacter sp.]|nr:hypothetical protein [Candidatus Angelobacter sp.]